MNIYKNESASQQLLNEKITENVIEEIKYNNGIYIYFKDVPYPIKGLPTLEALAATNIVKKLLLEGIRTFKYTLPFLSKKAIKSFNIIANQAFNPYLLKDEFMNYFSRELKEILSPIDPDFAELIAHIFEYDNAYRLRVQDILSETTKEKLIKRPYREVKRLFKLSLERDNIVTGKRMESFSIIPLALLIPKYRKMFRKALYNSDFERLQFDLSDRYWAAQRIDYKFFGMTNEERMKQFKDLYE